MTNHSLCSGCSQCQPTVGHNSTTYILNTCSQCGTGSDTTWWYTDGLVFCSLCYKTPIQITGWICSRCNKSNAPSIKQCDCK